MTYLEFKKHKGNYEINLFHSKNSKSHYKNIIDKDVNKLAQIKLQGDNAADIESLKSDYQSSIAFGNMIGSFLTGGWKTFKDLF